MCDAKMSFQFKKGPVGSLNERLTCMSMSPMCDAEMAFQFKKGPVGFLNERLTCMSMSHVQERPVASWFCLLNPHQLSWRQDVGVSELRREQSARLALVAWSSSGCRTFQNASLLTRGQCVLTCANDIPWTSAVPIITVAFDAGPASTGFRTRNESGKRAGPGLSFAAFAVSCPAVQTGKAAQTAEGRDPASRRLLASDFCGGDGSNPAKEDTPTGSLDSLSSPSPTSAAVPGPPGPGRNHLPTDGGAFGDWVSAAGNQISNYLFCRRPSRSLEVASLVILHPRRFQMKRNTSFRAAHSRIQDGSVSEGLFGAENPSQTRPSLVQWLNPQPPSTPSGSPAVTPPSPKSSPFLSPLPASVAEKPPERAFRHPALRMETCRVAQIMPSAGRGSNSPAGPWGQDVFMGGGGTTLPASPGFTCVFLPPCSASSRKARAVYPCEAEHSSELSFEIGAIFEDGKYLGAFCGRLGFVTRVLSQRAVTAQEASTCRRFGEKWPLFFSVQTSREPGWLEGTLNGKRGLIPQNYVKLL
ncbi:Rho GTPase-activating protein 10 [Galemys pyrenaicus]|uniref:Rho GTPase-activating protein 10 n=1 Tax=Galemys pyrenaicus TaxID=202257 RepID=A0A8J6AB63_GALPY|nr:Rho GTPase-activating protein 10 [Galemys pyrenaicus]